MNNEPHTWRAVFDPAQLYDPVRLGLVFCDMNDWELYTQALKTVLALQICNDY